MSAINTGDLVRAMVQAAKSSLGDDWPEARMFVEAESEKYAESLKRIVTWQQEGKIDEEEANSLLRLHNRSMKMVLTAAKGISLKMAERAVNAALDAVRNTVNRAIGWQLL